MKSILFVDHYYHKKTRSNSFLSEILLRENYSVDYVYLRENYDDLPDSNYKKTYDIVILFQYFPKRESLLKKTTWRKGVYIPMYDGYAPIESRFWLEYSDFKIVYFSTALETIISRKYNIDSFYIKYYPRLKKISNFGNESWVYFWKRIDKINLSTLYKVLGWRIQKITLNTNFDPYNKKPTSLLNLFPNIKLVEWFESPLSLDEEIQKSSIYFAPRSSEGIGLSFLNAMALGRCVVAPDNPTMNEYIVNGVNGYLYDLNNPQKIKLKNIRQIQHNAIGSVVRGRKKFESDSVDLLCWLAKKNENQTYSYQVIIDIEDKKIEDTKRLDELKQKIKDFDANISNLFYLSRNKEQLLGHPVFFIDEEFDFGPLQGIYISDTFRVPSKILSEPNVIKILYLNKEPETIEDLISVNSFDIIFYNNILYEKFIKTDKTRVKLLIQNKCFEFNNHSHSEDWVEFILKSLPSLYSTYSSRLLTFNQSEDPILAICLDIRELTIQNFIDQSIEVCNSFCLSPNDLARVKVSLLVNEELYSYLSKRKCQYQLDFVNIISTSNIKNFIKNSSIQYFTFFNNESLLINRNYYNYLIQVLTKRKPLIVETSILQKAENLFSVVKKPSILMNIDKSISINLNGLIFSKSILFNKLNESENNEFILEKFLFEACLECYLFSEEALLHINRCFLQEKIKVEVYLATFSKKNINDFVKKKIKYKNFSVDLLKRADMRVNDAVANQGLNSLSKVEGSDIDSRVIFVASKLDRLLSNHFIFYTARVLYRFYKVIKTTFNSKR